MQQTHLTLALSACSMAAVLTALAIGSTALPGSAARRPLLLQYAQRTSVLPWAKWDAMIYKDIALQDYRRLPSGCSTAVFLPGHPIAIRVVSRVSGISTDAVLLLLPNVIFLAVVAMFPAYIRTHSWATTKHQILIVGLFCCWPLSLFFHVGYSESLFVATVLGFLLCLRTNRSMLLAAVLAGLSFTIRAVGLALTIVLVCYAWRRTASNWPSRLGLGGLVLVSLWGVAAVSMYQWATIGDPLAFVRERPCWDLRLTYHSGEHILSLLSFEPLWSTYWPGAVPDQRVLGHPGCVFCSLTMVNPIVFVFVLTILLYGQIKGVLSNSELLLSLMLIGIPYITHAYQNMMVSQGRYAVVCVPFYVAFGHLLGRLPAVVVGLLLVVCFVFLMLWSAGFGGGCLVI